jgi:polyisoprenoid-binding protein YceI
MRNEHMRDNYLNTAQYPKATFKVTRVDTQVRPPFKPGQVVPVLAKGELTVHGKTVPKVVPIKVTYWPESPVTQKRFKAGNLIRIQGAFPVSLKEHGIPVPEIANQKLAQTIQVSVDAFGTDNPAALK